MFLPTPRRSPESISAIAIGLTAGATSAVLTGWAHLTLLGHAIIFVGSAMSGTAFAYWASRSSSPAAAIGKSGLGGALQANISATALLYLAWKVEEALRLTTSPQPPGDFGGFAIIILLVGSIVGFVIGMFYAIVPALVAHWRKAPRLVSTDHAMIASSIFVAVAALAHANITKEWMAWAPLALLSLSLATAAAIRTKLRNAFLARVRAGEEPRYRIEPAEGVSVLYRVAAEEEDRETSYRENAAPPPEPTAIGVL